MSKPSEKRAGKRGRAEGVGPDSVSERTLSNLRRAVEQRPRDRAARIELAQALRRLGRRAEALAALGERRATAAADAPWLHLHGALLVEEERLAEAEADLLDGSRLAPGNPDLAYDLGVCLRKQGRKAEAVERFRQAAAARKGFVRALYSLGVELQALGRSAEAEAAYREALAAQPDHAEARNNLGIIYRDRGELDRAVEMFQEAVRARKGFTLAMFNLAEGLRALNRLDESAEAYRACLQIDPKHIRAYEMLGVLLRRQHKLEESAKLLNSAIKACPPDVAIYIELANTLSQMGRLPQVAKVLRAALAFAPESRVANYNLGNALREMDDTLGAIECYRRALAVSPRYSLAHNNLGIALMERGRFGEAIASYRAALDADPDNASALANLIKLVEHDVVDGDMRQAESILAAPRSNDETAMSLGFALAKAHGDVGDNRRAFEHMIRANALKRKTIEFDIEAVRETFRMIAEVFHGDFFAGDPGGGDSSAAPIFIVGMPRSGTTLIEQILASHSAVHGAGELNHLQAVAGPFVAYLRGGWRPESAAKLIPGWREAGGKDYLSLVGRLPAGKTRVTDKQPVNFPYVGVIRAILPNAKVIHCCRDPLDTCLSNFRLMFTGGLPFTYDLRELGIYYTLYRQMMAHWHEVLPGFVFDVHYEDMVADQEGTTRRLLEFCGLPWEDSCLSFHQTERTVRTASLSQVRQPIYRGSVGAWRAYADHLGPLFEALGMAPPAGSS